MANRFREVTRALRLIPSIVAGLLEFADDVAKSFMNRIGRFLKEGRELTAAHIAALQEALAGMMEEEGQMLEEAEQGHRDHLRQEKKVRLLRDEVAEVLYQILLRVRLRRAHPRADSLCCQAFAKDLGVRPWATLGDSRRFRDLHEGIILSLTGSWGVSTEAS